MFSLLFWRLKIYIAHLIVVGVKGGRVGRDGFDRRFREKSRQTVKKKWRQTRG